MNPVTSDGRILNHVLAAAYVASSRTKLLAPTVTPRTLKATVHERTQGLVMTVISPPLGACTNYEHRR